MTPRPSVIVFDVNETLSDMSTMAGRFADVGAPSQLAKLWFASLLRDGFALTAAGAQRPFAELAVATLRTVLHGVELDRDLDAAIGHVMDGFARLRVRHHPPAPLRTSRTAATQDLERSGREGRLRRLLEHAVPPGR